MARLLVEAVRDEEILKTEAAAKGVIDFYVSVSEAESGAAVTKLEAANFRVTSHGAPGGSFVYELSVTPSVWPGGKNEAAGFYHLRVVPTAKPRLLGFAFDKGVNYSFGIQVRRFTTTGRPADLGQTVVSVMGYGHTVFAIPESGA